MRIVLQRVSKAELWIETQLFSSIQKGLVVFLGIEEDDTEVDVLKLSKKIVNLRIFPNEKGLMDQSVIAITGEILLVSQFTLLGDTKKGNRPSFIKAAKPETAIPLYDSMIGYMQTILGEKLKTGKFGADMQIELTNEGPVTILIDSKGEF